MFVDHHSLINNVIMWSTEIVEKMLHFFLYKLLIACNNCSQTSSINKVVSKSDFVWLYLILKDYLNWALKMKE